MRVERHMRSPNFELLASTPSNNFGRIDQCNLLIRCVLYVTYNKSR
jgi:hypothetical protein